MSIRILYSDDVAGKRNQIINEIVEKQSATESKLIYIVPQQYSFESEKLLTRATGNKGFMQIQVLSFARLAHVLANEVGGRARKTMNGLGKAMLLYDTYRKHQGEFEVFNIATNKTGFTEVTEELFAEFKRNLLKPEDIRGLSQYFEKESMQEKKFCEIARLYELYEEKVLANEIDQEDLINLLISNIPKSKDLRDCFVWIDGYHGLTGQQLEIVKALAGVAAQVTVGLTADYFCEDMRINELDIFSATKELGNKICELARKQGQVCRIEKADESWGVEMAKELVAFRENALKVNSVPMEMPVPGLKLVKAFNSYEEGVWVARQIVELIKNEGYSFEDIAVVCPNVESYASVLGSVLESFGINYYVDSKPRLNNNILVRFIVGLMKLMANSWRLEDVLGLLKLYLLPLKRDEVDRLEEYVVANNVLGSAWYREEPWDFKYGAFNDHTTVDVEVLDEIRKRALMPIRELQEKLLGGKPASEVASCIYDFLVELGIEKKAKSYNDEHFRDAWNWIVEALEQLSMVFGDENLTVSKLYDLFTIAFAQVEGAMVPMKRDVVIVGDVNRSRLHEKKALFIMRTVEGAIPKLQLVEGVITDEERELFRKNGVPLAAPLKKRMWDTNVDLYTLFSVPTQKVYISYPIAEMGGQSVRASSLIAKVERLFPQVEKISTIEHNDFCYSTQQDLFNQLVLRAKENDEEGTKLHRYFEDKKEYKEKLSAMLKGVYFKGETQHISSESMVGVLGDEFSSSITKLEQYAKCPYSYFVKHVLKIKDLERFEFNRLDIGNVSHKILELYFKYIKENRNEVEDWNKVKSDVFVDEIIRQNYSFDKMNTAYRENAEFLVIFAFVESMIKASCWYCLKSFLNSSFEFKEFEKKVVKEYGIELPEGKSVAVKITGIVDRIDSFKTKDCEYIRIIDYKTGHKSFDYEKVYLGMQLQLLCYLKMIVEQGASMRPGGVLYQQIHNKKLKLSTTDMEELELERQKTYKMSGIMLNAIEVLEAMDKNYEGADSSIEYKKPNKEGEPCESVLSKEQLDEILDFSDKKVEGFLTDILLGRIGADPYMEKDKPVCEYCEFNLVCDFDPSFKNCNYRQSLGKKKKDFFEAIGKGDSENGN